MNPTILWPPNKQANMILLKDSFSWRYLRNKWLRADEYCEESDSAQANTGRSFAGINFVLFWISAKNYFFRKKHFSPLLRDPGVFDSWEKEKCQKNLVTLKKSIEIFYLVFHQVRLNIKFLSLRRFWFLEGKQQWYEDFKFVKSCTYLNINIIIFLKGAFCESLKIRSDSANWGTLFSFLNKGRGSYSLTLNIFHTTLMRIFTHTKRISYHPNAHIHTH